MIFGDSGFLHRSFRNTVGVLIWIWAIFLFMIEYYGGGGGGNNNDVRPPLFRDVFVLLVKVLLAAPFGTCVAGERIVEGSPPGFGRGPANVQYMSMNPNGQYSFAYSSAESSRQEKRNSDGSVTGQYTYTDPSGKLVHVDYSANAEGGFKAYGENISTSPGSAPVQVQDTPAVQEARQKFLATYAREYARAQAVAAAAVIQESLKTASVREPLVGKIPQTPPAIMTSTPEKEQNSSLETKVYSPTSENSKIIQLDGTQSGSVTRGNGASGAGIPVKTENVVKSQSGPAYFYYVGVGGQPYYVTPPGRPNTDVAVSVRATQLGAIPVAAVHDVQIPHYGSGYRNNQVQNQPMYVEIGKDYENPNHQYQYIRQAQPQQHNFGFRHTYSAQPAGQQQRTAHYDTTTTVFTLPYFGYPNYF